MMGQSELLILVGNVTVQIFQKIFYLSLENNTQYQLNFQVLYMADLITVKIFVDLIGSCTWAYM